MARDSWGYDPQRRRLLPVRPDQIVESVVHLTASFILRYRSARMDADVISMEAARSGMELLATFTSCKYPNNIGPGVCDIHSPRVPGVDEVEALIRKALEVFRPEQLWGNPDCGLKTRRWEEVRPALENMVTAARRVRETGLLQRGADPRRRITRGK